MTLLKKISGIRGTIGGQAGTSLSPVDIVEMVSAFGMLLKEKQSVSKIVVGRDARISGGIVSQLAINTLLAMGFDVIDLGLSTTPTVEMAVEMSGAGGGIIFTASHNPRDWNALKLLNSKGEFISASEGQHMLKIAESGEFVYAGVDALGKYLYDDSYIGKHIDRILALDYIRTEAIQQKGLLVVVDSINSTGTVSIIPLLKRLGCRTLSINETMSGDFAHNPEPLPHNLKQLSKAVIDNKADLGIAVDPDVDRLVLVCPDGSMFGEEYTIVACADYVLRYRDGATVSNMSSSRALEDIAIKYGQKYHQSAVGEVNVVEKMKEVGAAIGGEGNGGVILPELHYGRDALVGIAIILSLLIEEEKTLTELKATYPAYHIIKKKFDISDGAAFEGILESLRKKYCNFRCNVEDGLRIDFEKSWVHLRKSNTEPVIRLIAEAEGEEKAQALIDDFEKQLNESK